MFKIPHVWELLLNPSLTAFGHYSTNFFFLVFGAGASVAVLRVSVSSNM
jgi:hypothetical protein